MRFAIPAFAAWVLVLPGVPARAQQPPGPVEAVTCAPGDADIAAALAGGAVHVTRDGGATWARMPLAEALPAEEEATVDDEDSGLEWGSPPFRDDGTDDPEAGAGDDDIEAEWIDDPEPEAPGEEERAVTLLAVADDGRFALARGTTLVLGGPGPGSRRELSIPPGARGMRFDIAGGLWFAAADRLLCFDPGGAAREVPVAVAGAPVRGPDGGVLVPLRSGLLLVGTDPGAPTAGGIRSLPVAADRVVAWDPARPEGAVVAARGRLEWVPLREGPAEALGRGFPDADRLLAGTGGVLILRRADGSWHRRGRGGWRRIDARDADLDARGRRWTAGDSGVVAPGAGPGLGSAIDRRPSEVGGHVEPIDELGPPPCEPTVLFPVPRVDLFFGIGHGSVRTAELPEETDRLGRRTWIAGGLRLTGTFGAGTRADCLGRWEAWAEHKEQRRRRLAALQRARALVAAELGVSSSRSRAGWLRLETERLTELIHLLTGGPAEEEGP